MLSPAIAPTSKFRPQLATQPRKCERGESQAKISQRNIVITRDHQKIYDNQ
jgi:hypothetical protein